ncbi:MAG TPA: uroporphyrinogen-III synthase [Natronosporangium sp.]
MAIPHRSPGSAGAIAPLAGYSVAIASDRRRHGVADLLESVGARTVGIQAARSVAKPDLAALREATERCLAAPCHEVVVSSALGLRAWITAARRWRLADGLVARFEAARLLARDAAAADGLRALGLSAIFSTHRETTEDLLRFLLAQPLAGRRVVIQTNQLALAEPCQALRAAGAEVIEAPTFTAQPPAESFSLRRLVDLVIRRQVDGLVLVGAVVAEQLCGQAKKEGRLPELRSALQYDVLCVALGQQTATPLQAHAVPAVLAERPFAEEVAEEVLRRLPQRGLQLAVGGHQLEVRGQAIVLDGRLIPVPDGPLSVLRALAREPGRVLSAAEIRRGEPSWADVDDHAVEMAVSRLRRLLAGADLVQTIVNRGYRLVA